MDSLDDGVLEMIFSYISFEDRKNVRFLCSKFRKVCGLSRFSQFEKLVIHPGYNTKFLGAVLKNNMSEILHLELRSIKLPEIPPTTWIDVCNKLTTLSLSQCFINTPVIVEIVEKCHRLRYLELFRNTDLNAKPVGDSHITRVENLRNIYILTIAFHILIQNKIRRENLEALHINIMDPLETLNPNFVDEYILVVFPGIKVMCITQVKSRRSSTFTPALNDHPLLTYSFSRHGNISCGWHGYGCPFPMLRSAEGFRQLISIRSLRTQLLLFIKNELEESIRLDVLRQRTNTGFHIWYQSCPILFGLFSQCGYIGNVHVDLRNGLLQFHALANRMLFSRSEFLTVLNSYLNSQNLGIFQLDDEDLFFYWIELPFDNSSPSLCIPDTRIIPEHELCQVLQQNQNLRQLKLINVTDNVLKKIFAWQRELLCLHVRMSTFGCPYCHYSAYRFNEKWARYEHNQSHFHVWEAASIRDLTNLQCLILDYKLVLSDVEFEEEALNEFILPALRHFSIYGTNQLFLWKIALKVATNAPNLELLEISCGCPFNVLRRICSVCKNLRYLRCDYEFYQYEHILHYDSRIILFENHDQLQVISQNRFHFFYDRNRRQVTAKLYELPPDIELKRCPFAPSMHS